MKKHHWPITETIAVAATVLVIALTFTAMSFKRQRDEAWRQQAMAVERLRAMEGRRK